MRNVGSLVGGGPPGIRRSDAAQLGRLAEISSVAGNSPCPENVVVTDLQHYGPYGRPPEDGVLRSEYGAAPLSGLLQLRLYF